MECNINMWMQHIIHEKKKRAIPIMTHPGIELIGKRVYDAVTDGAVHFQAIKALNDHYPASACSQIMDLTVEAEAFGAEIDFPTDDIPNVIGRLVDDYTSVDSLVIPDLTQGRIPQYLLAGQLALQAITDKPIFAGMIGPFSLAGRLFGLSELMIACYCELETIDLLLKKCTSFLKNYCAEYKKQGIHGVIIAEPAAGLLSNEDCLRFSSLYIREIVKNLQDDNFIVILHNCGNTGHCTQATIATHANGYHFGNNMNMVEALKNCPSNTLVMGNLDPVSLLKNGTPESVKSKTTELLTLTAEYPNFILSSGCDIPPHTPHDNIKAFYDALDNYNRSILC